MLLSLQPGTIVDHTRDHERRRIRDDVAYREDAVCLAVIVYSREKGTAQEADFPSIFPLSDRGLPLYLPSFLSRRINAGDLITG